MSVKSAETELYSDIWRDVTGYGQFAPGEQYLPLFTEIINLFPNRRPQNTTILDAGCGSGKAAAALHAASYNVRLCDLTDEGLVPEARHLPFYSASLWNDLYFVTRGFGHPNRTTADFVYCCDVLEHIPKQFTMLAIDQMLRVADTGLFLSVSLVPDSFGVWAGKNLHQTVESFVWWRDALRELGHVGEARDLLANAIFFVSR